MDRSSGRFSLIYWRMALTLVPFFSVSRNSNRFRRAPVQSWSHELKEQKLAVESGGVSLVGKRLFQPVDGVEERTFLQEGIRRTLEPSS